MDCCMYILFAMSFGLVRMFSYVVKWWSFKIFKNFPINFFGLISYNFLYLEMDFLIHSFLYLVVILLACILAILANVAISFIQLFLSKSSFGGGGMLM